MKKATTLLSIAALMLALSACGEAEQTSGKTTAVQTEAEEASVSATSEETKLDSQQIASEENTVSASAESSATESASARSADKKGGFKQTATIEETVLIDEGGLKVTANALTYSRYAASLELTIENESGEDLKIMSGTLGYSCNSVNGLMMDSGYFHSEVKTGKKAKESVSFDYDDLLLYGIDEIADIELGIYSETKDYDHTYYPVSQIKTSAADSYAYDNEGYHRSLTSSEMQSALGYHITYSAEDILYDVDDVSVVSEMMLENEDGDFIVLLEALNHSAYQTRLYVDDIYINGINFYSSLWTSELINPGKTAMIMVNLSDVFSEVYWEMFGITEIRNIKLGVGQSDMKGDYDSGAEMLEISFIDGEDSVDTSGTTVYDEDGVRLICKGIAGGKSEYDDSLHAMLLIENKSGKAILIDDAYNSLSINGYMTDSYIYSKTVADNEYAVWEIEMPKRQLKEIGVEQISDIEEIDFDIEIRDENWRNERGGKVVIILK